jgi:hypothetical protein
MRSLGEFRFTIFTLLRIAKLRKYKAKIWYKPVKKSAALGLSLKSDDDDETGSEPTTLEDEPINFKPAEIETETEVDEDPDSSEKEEGSVVDEAVETTKGMFLYENIHDD